MTVYQAPVSLCASGVDVPECVFYTRENTKTNLVPHAAYLRQLRCFICSYRVVCPLPDGLA